MSSLISSSTAAISSATAVTSTSAAATASQPLTIILRTTLEGTNDFFPFDDIASLGSSGSKGDSVTFKDLIENNIDGSQEILLFSTGCQIDGEADCTRACSDNSIFYGSLETFYNCAALASIAYWTHTVKTYYVSAEAEANASSIMGAGTLDSFDGDPVLDSFIMCAQASCSTDGLAQPCHASIGKLSTETSTARDILDAMDTFCPDIAAEINPDIFGPGVLISYVLQVCFSSSLWAFLKIFTFYVQYTQKKNKDEARERPAQPRRLKRTITGLTRIDSIIWPDSSALSRTSIAVATTLVEFQEAQCWFVFAVQIASILAIVVNSQEGTFWGEIITNAGVGYHISLNGILPMFLVQICLHNEGIRNWHTFIGFYVEYILAIVAATQKVQFSDAFELFRSQNAIPACGGNPSPRTYCAATQGVDGLQLSFYPHPLLYKLTFLILDTIAILVLTTDQLAWTLRKHHRTEHISIGGQKLGRWPHHRTRPRWLIVSRWFWRFLEVAYLIVNILYMVSLLKVINAESFAANRWSYGQIIAMTVWGPVIIKLFDLILSGPPRNSMKLNDGPPRLRIDNYINHRSDTAAEDDFVVDEYHRRKSRPDILTLGSIPRPGPMRNDSPDHMPKDGASQDTPLEDGPDPEEPQRISTLRFEEEGRRRRRERSESP